jgi:hypothetical protein
MSIFVAAFHMNKEKKKTIQVSINRIDESK